MTITSGAFAAGDAIPKKYSCDGDGVSPALAWASPPAGAQAFALIMDDPDAPLAGGFTHWVVFNMPATQRGLDENVDKARAELAVGGAQGNNDGNRLGYTGPCPPQGGPAHTYRFNLYALGGPVTLQPGATKAQLLAAMQDKVLGQALLTGKYQRGGQ